MTESKTVESTSTVSLVPTAKSIVRLATGIMLPRTIAVRHEQLIDDVSYLVEIAAEWTDGRYRVRRLEVTTESGNVTSAVLRHVPIAAIISTHASINLWLWEPTENGVKMRPGDVTEIEDEVQRAAAVYQLAHAVGLPPSRAVSNSLGIPYATAKKRVTQARERGLLGETLAGRAKG